MKIEQISVKYHSIEDRLLLSITTSEEDQDDVQFNYYMTRSLTKKFMPVVDKYFDTEQMKISATMDDESKDEIKQMQHNRMLEEVDFGSEAAEESNTSEDEADNEEDVEEPLMEVKPALLLERLYMKPLESEKVMLSFSPNDPEAGISVSVTMKFLHGLYQLFVNAIRKSDWDFNMSEFVDVNSGDAIQETQVTVDAKKLN